MYCHRIQHQTPKLVGMQRDFDVPHAFDGDGVKLFWNDVNVFVVGHGLDLCRPLRYPKNDAIKFAIHRVSVDLAADANALGSNTATATKYKFIRKQEK